VLWEITITHFFHNEMEPRDCIHIFFSQGVCGISEWIYVTKEIIWHGKMRRGMIGLKTNDRKTEEKHNGLTHRIKVSTSPCHFSKSISIRVWAFSKKKNTWSLNSFKYIHAHTGMVHTFLCCRLAGCTIQSLEI